MSAVSTLVFGTRLGGDTVTTTLPTVIGVCGEDSVIHGFDGLYRAVPLSSGIVEFGGTQCSIEIITVKRIPPLTPFYPVL